MSDLSKVLNSGYQACEDQFVTPRRLVQQRLIPVIYFNQVQTLVLSLRSAQNLYFVTLYGYLIRSNVFYRPPCCLKTSLYYSTLFHTCSPYGLKKISYDFFITSNRDGDLYFGNNTMVHQMNHQLFLGVFLSILQRFAFVKRNQKLRVFYGMYLKLYLFVVKRCHLPSDDDRNYYIFFISNFPFFIICETEKVGAMSTLNVIFLPQLL